jgi:hypothetical protein
MVNPVMPKHEHESVRGGLSPGPETRAKTSATLKAKDLTGENNPFYGKTPFFVFFLRKKRGTKKAMSAALSGSNHYCLVK